MNSKKYNNTKLILSVGKGFLTFILLLLFVLTGLSKELVFLISNYFQNEYLILLIFTVSAGIIFSIIFFPLNFYSEYILEHKYNLSNQNVLKWFLENAKSTLVAAVIGIPLLILFYYLLITYENLWWLPFAITLFIVSVVLARIVPVFILPLFYKIIPYENELLKERIKILSENAGIKLENIYSFDMSKNTKKANAAFTGIGKSKRIILGDTLIENYSDDEIESVIAHELGHYKHKHITKNIIQGTVNSFLTLFLIAYFYQISIGWFGFESITEIAALPLLTLWGMLIGLIQTPISSFISRKYEYEADRYAVSVTGTSEHLIASLNKLTDQNLGDKNPHPFVEWYFYSHPSVEKRVNSMLEFEKSIKNNLVESGGVLSN